jgi:hypothetical protein
MIDSIDEYYVAKIRKLELVSGADYMSDGELLVTWSDPSQWWNNCQTIQQDLYKEYNSVKKFIKTVKTKKDTRLNELITHQLSDNS